VIALVRVALQLLADALRFCCPDLSPTPVTDGARCLAEFSAEFECDAGRERELGELIGQGVFQAGFDASRRRFMR
jgi:hypothetical protein